MRAISYVYEMAELGKPNPAIELSRGWMTLSRSIVAIHLQFIRHRKRTKHAARSNVSQLLVHLVTDHSCKRNVPIIDDDVQRWIGTHQVARKSSSPCNLAIGSRAN